MTEKRDPRSLTGLSGAREETRSVAAATAERSLAAFGLTDPVFREIADRALLDPDLQDALADFARFCTVH